jgi:DNA-binding NarL/FixJ family response regulator
MASELDGSGTEASERIRVLIADDHPVIRYGLRHLLQVQPDLLVVGEAATGSELLEKAVGLAPEVVLLDLELGDFHGVDALRRLRDRAPKAAVIVYTAFDSEERIFEAVEIGVQGYIIKGSDIQNVPQAIRIVHQGGTFLEPAVATKLMARMRHHRGDAEGSHAVLTDRERQVVSLLAKGKCNRDIATALFISERTVKFHLSAILSKLGAKNRTEALLLAAQRGLIDL